jgi:hypothetical protein
VQRSDGILRVLQSGIQVWRQVQEIGQGRSFSRRNRMLFHYGKSCSGNHVAFVTSFPGLLFRINPPEG